MPPVPVALTIAGSDCSGGAGIQADLKTFAALGVYGASALTALTVQNTLGVHDAMLLEPRFVAAQIAAVADDLGVTAAKTGMLATAAIIEAVAEAIDRHRIAPLVVDPVMVAKGGDSLIDDAAVAALAQLLLPRAALVTPNRHEARRILGLTDELSGPDDWAEAARAICRRSGAGACIVKGTRVGDRAVDAFYDGRQVRMLEAAWFETPQVHGSGCTFSSAACGFLALGRPLEEAVEAAKAFAARAIAHPLHLGRGRGPVNHLAGGS